MKILPVVLSALVFSGCAASPQRVRGDEQLIDASYHDFDCAQLAQEAEVLEVERQRAHKESTNPAQWIPIINLFTLAPTLKGTFDLQAAQERIAGVVRAQEKLGCTEAA
jgi:hypothetical protein